MFAAYYTCSDLREAKEPLRVFLSEATAALQAGESPENLGLLLKTRLLRNSERLDYHLDGDLPMVMYRLWLRWVRWKRMQFQILELLRPLTSMLLFDFKSSNRRNFGWCTAGAALEGG